MSDAGAKITAPTKLPTLITTPMSWLYRIGIAYRNRAFDRGKGVRSLQVPVISIGNLSTGGTGKTPMVHQVVRLLQERGHHPVIAMRGYGAKANEKGDEQREHELALPGIPIVAQPDRFAGLRDLFAGEHGQLIDCVVLDDGFQHRQIARDLDVVLVDATRPPQLDALLPKGHLRESIDSLNRAGLMVLTHCERLDEAAIERLRESLMAHVAQGVRVLTSKHVWTGCLVHTRCDELWVSTPLQLEEVRGRVCHLVCGIGNAHAFEQIARSHGIVSKGHLQLQDHQALTQQMIDGQLAQSEAQDPPNILMTRKDWVKACDGLRWPEGASVIVPELRLEIDDPMNELDSLLESLFCSLRPNHNYISVTQ